MHWSSVSFSFDDIFFLYFFIKTSTVNMILAILFFPNDMIEIEIHIKISCTHFRYKPKKNLKNVYSQVKPFLQIAETLNINS